MKTAIATLESTAPYSQSKFIDPDEHPKIEKENGQDFEKRIWRQRVHQNSAGNVIIPPTAFKNCIAEAAKFLNLQVPGKGKSTYTKHFEAGVMVVDPLVMALKWGEVKCQKLHLPSDGKRGGGKRVIKYMPIIHEWAGDVQFLILDETITESVFRKVLEEAGRFIGIGTFRPRNNGTFGRFEVVNVKWI
jgi:hypothetical protein